MSTSKQQGISYLPPEGGEMLWVLGDQVTFKTDGERDGLTLFVSTIPPGGGPPPHVHYAQEEAHYVLEGTFSFLNGNEWVEAHAGSFIWIPRGVRHTFRNPGPETGRLFSTNTLPGVHERWFRHVGVPMTDQDSFQPPQGSPDIEDVLSSAAREDIHLGASGPHVSYTPKREEKYRLVLGPVPASASQSDSWWITTSCCGEEAFASCSPACKSA